MKKITFILLGLISGTAIAQNSSSATATVSAELVSPLTITKAVDLDFGKIAVGPAAGAVRVLTNGTASYSDSEMEIPSNVVTAAKFTITGGSGTAFNIYIPSTTLTGAGGDPMSLNLFHDLNDLGNEIGSDAVVLNVGGLLSVNANQNPGEYTGTVQVTVSYE